VRPRVRTWQRFGKKAAGMGSTYGTDKPSPATKSTFFHTFALVLVKKKVLLRNFWISQILLCYGKVSPLCLIRAAVFLLA
jgi:hypothetical protein